jgi:hypothetical protein
LCGLGDVDEGGRVRVGQRADERGVHKGEDGGAGSDAEREHEDRGEGEAEISAELAEGVEEVLKGGLEPEGDRFVSLLLEDGCVAELAGSCMMGCLRGHAFGTEVGLFLLAEEGHLFVEVVDELLATEEHAEFFEEACERIHGVLLGVLQDATDGCDHLLELREFAAELFAAGGGEGVEARAAVGFGHLPLGFDPVLQEEALQCGIERALFDG